MNVVFTSVRAGVAAWLLLAATAVCAGGSVYRAVDLGVRMPRDSAASGLAINASGQVAGQLFLSNGVIRGMVTGPGGDRPREIGSLGGTWTAANAINDAGRVVGTSALSAHENLHPFLLADDGRTLIDLGSLGGGQAAAYGINAAGQIVGGAQDGDGVFHAFMTTATAGMLQDLGTLGGAAANANGINDAGQVVGWADNASGVEHAFITGPNGQGMRDLGKAAWQGSTAYGINARGQVVGTIAGADNRYGAFVTGADGQHLHRIPLPGNVDGASLKAINALGRAVGSEHLRRAAYSTAVIADPRGQVLVALDTLTTLPPGVSLTVASGINDRNEIVAMGTDQHAYLLFPN